MNDAEDRLEAARQVMRDLAIGADWEAVIEPGMPPELDALNRENIAAYRRADLDWLLEHADPDIEIVQVPEIPDARTYRGPEGLIDALLDWPRQWRDFTMEPRRIFAADDDHVVVVSLHRGRPHSVDIEVEAEIVFLFRWRDGVVTRWDMFLTVDDALRRAAQSSADGHDDHATQGDRRE